MMTADQQSYSKQITLRKRFLHKDKSDSLHLIHFLSQLSLN